MMINENRTMKTFAEVTINDTIFRVEKTNSGQISKLNVSTIKSVKPSGLYIEAGFDRIELTAFDERKSRFENGSYIYYTSSYSDHDIFRDLALTLISSLNNQISERTSKIEDIRKTFWHHLK